MSVLVFVSCSPMPPEWKAYREAMKCHFQNKGVECDKHYEKAISKSKKGKIPVGLHASYGVHQHVNGNSSAAAENFRKEIEINPDLKKAVTLALQNTQSYGMGESENQSNTSAADSTDSSSELKEEGVNNEN